VTALQELLTGLVDYAGLFPPAGLAMGTAVANYAGYRAGQDAFALGRFVTPVARFAKLEAAFNGLAQQHGCWHIAALLGEDWAADFAAIADLNHRMAGRMVVDSVEAKTAKVADIRRLATLTPPTITAYCELDPARWPAHIAAVKDCGLRAKIRTGGLVAQAFPAAEAIAEFLLHCVQNRVAFKATAGLHHPVRCTRPLTYEADAPSGTMHGFLNVFLAAALALRGADAPAIAAFLNSPDGTPDAATPAATFAANQDTLEWQGETFTAGFLHQVRTSFAIAFGSCSFTEPLEDLRELKIL